MKNIALELEFDGPDAHVTSTALINFGEAFKKDPTNAAHELHRYLTAAVESKKNGKPMHIKYKSKGRSNVFSVSAFIAGPGKRPGYDGIA